MTGLLRSIAPMLNAPFLVAATMLGASLVLGGGTRSGFLADAVLQLISIPLLLFVLARWTPHGTGAEGRWSTRIALLICLLLVLLHVLQLVPLPSTVWAKLGGRDLVAATYQMLDRELPWMPLSVSPRATWLALLSFLPVIVVFLAAVQLGYRERRALSLLIIGFACFSVFYGMLQVAQGPSSPLRLFPFTNQNEAVGLFANRNHYAALLYSALLLMAPWAAAASADMAATSRRKGYPTAVVIAAIASFTIIVMLLSAQAMARSRAGMALAVIAIIAALMLPMTVASRRSQGNGTGRIIVLGTILALIFAGQFALDRVMERFDTDTFADARIPYARNTIEAARTFMPFGSGIGSFVAVYGSFEKPADLHRTYANRTHNDILEAWLETGLLGIVVFALFLAWYFGRSISLLRTKVDKRQRIDALVARSALIVIALLLAHSLADYPLRTGAMAAVFAFCCALLLPPPPAVQASEDATYQMASVPEKPHKSPRKRRSTTSPTMATEQGQEFNPFIARGDSGSPPPGAAAPVNQAPPPRPPRSRASDVAWPSMFNNATSASPGVEAPPDQRGGKWSTETGWPDEWLNAAKPTAADHAPPRPTDKPDKSK